VSIARWWNQSGNCRLHGCKSTENVRRKRKQTESVTLLPAWNRKGCRFVSCTTNWMQSHTPCHLQEVGEGLFNGDQVLGIGDCKAEVLARGSGVGIR